MGDLRSLSYCNGFETEPKTLDKYYKVIQNARGFEAGYSVYHGRSWISGWELNGPTYMHVLPINTRQSHFHDHGVTPDTLDGDILITPTSRHPGGVNLMLGDGHVVFVPNDVDMRVWWATGSRNGGEPEGGHFDQ